MFQLSKVAALAGAVAITATALTGCAATDTRAEEPAATAPATEATAPPVVSQSQFDQMFPESDPFYTYGGLTEAMSAFPAFATTGTSNAQKLEAAAFLANVSHETGGLEHIVEAETANYSSYCDPLQPYICPAGNSAYYGRGPLQLSWNFNYYAAGEALGVDLLEHPDLVATDATVSWESALWFWNSATGSGSQTAHDAMANGAGFGETIRAINGALECDGQNVAQMQSRIDLYQQFATILGATVDSVAGC